MLWAESEISDLTVCILCITTKAIIQHSYSTLKMSQRHVCCKKKEQTSSWDILTTIYVKYQKE